MKLSTDTLIGQVQSVVLWTDEMQSHEKLKHKQILELSANRLSAESNIKNLSELQSIQNLHLSIYILLENMQPVALERRMNSNKEEHQTYTKLLVIQGFQIFKERLAKKYGH